MPDIAYVDTIDVCHLRCPTCIRGLRGMENTTDKMDLEVFERVLARLRQQGFRKGRGCELMFNQMAIDCRGDVYLCCAMPYYPAFRLGPFLDLSPEQILVAKFTHSNCRTCTMPRRRRSWLENRRLSAAFRAVGHGPS
jgi:hypothetical protein